MLGSEKRLEKVKKLKIKTWLLLDYKINLAMMEGSGDSPCPKCGAKLSPEDQTETTCSIKEIKTRKDRLKELAIQCNTCESLIHLAGFKLLDSLE